MYVVRVFFNGQYIPGFLSGNKKTAVFGYDLKEHLSLEFDVFVGTKFTYMDTLVPLMDKIDYTTATSAGQIKNSKLYYLARRKMQNAVIPGRVDVIKDKCAFSQFKYFYQSVYFQPEIGRCCFVYSGKEQCYEQCEVMSQGNC